MARTRIINNDDGSRACAHRSLSVCRECFESTPNLIDVGDVVYKWHGGIRDGWTPEEVAEIRDGNGSEYVRLSPRSTFDPAIDALPVGTRAPALDTEDDDTDPCATCGVIVDGLSTAVAHHTPDFLKIVAWTCSDKCSDAYEATRTSAGTSKVAPAEHTAPVALTLF